MTPARDKLAELQRHLLLLERHMTAYAAHPSIPQDAKDQYLAGLTAECAEINREIKSLLQ